MNPLGHTTGLEGWLRCVKPGDWLLLGFIALWVVGAYAFTIGRCR